MGSEKNTFDLRYQSFSVHGSWDSTAFLYLCSMLSNEVVPSIFTFNEISFK